MTWSDSDLDNVLVSEREHWQDGPPHELFARLRARVPGPLDRRTSPSTPSEAGYWSVTTADDVHTVSRDWQTYSSELRRHHRADRLDPPARAHAGDVHRDGPAQARPPQGALPARLHAEADRRARGRRSARSRSTCSTGSTGRETCDLVTDVAQPVVSRVIGSFMGIPPEDDAIWARLMNTTLGAGDPDLNPEGARDRHAARRARDLRALPRADRRAPRAPDRRPHERARARRGRRREARGARDRHGLLPAHGGRQRQHQGDLLQRDAGAAWSTPSSASCCSTTRR